MTFLVILKTIFFFLLFPIAIYLMYLILNGLSDIGIAFANWRKEGEALDSSSFTQGNVYCRMELPLNEYFVPKEPGIFEIRDGTSEYVYRYTWLSNYELFFIKKVSHTSMWTEVFRGAGEGYFPILITKNHVKIENGIAYITSRLIKGGMSFLWFWTIISLLVALYSLIRIVIDFSLFNVLISVFVFTYCVLAYLVLNHFPKKEIRYALNLIAVEQYHNPALH